MHSFGNPYSQGMYDHPPMMHAASDPVCTIPDCYNHYNSMGYPQYPHGSYPMYGASSTALVPMSRRLTSGLLTANHPTDSPTDLAQGYDDMDAYDRDYDYDGGYGGGAPMTPIMPRSRRNSAASFASNLLPGMNMDTFHRGTGHRIKFKRKGGFMGGIGLDEAQARVRLSNNDSYTFHDLHSDHHRRILLKVKVNTNF